MGRKKKIEPVIEAPTLEVKTIQGAENGEIPPGVVPIVMDDRIYAETPSIPSLTDSIQEQSHAMVNLTRDQFNHSDDALIAELDKKFVSALIAETCCSEHRRLDETLMRAVVKSQLFDDTFKKMEFVNRDELYNDVVNILDLSYDYTKSNVENITSLEFHYKLCDILRKYNPDIINRLNRIQVTDNNPRQLENDGNA